MDDDSSPILAKGLLQFSNKEQQYAGIMNVIMRYLNTLFTMHQLVRMQSTVLNCIEVVVDVRRGPRAVLPTSKTQCIPVPLRQLREINERAERDEQLRSLQQQERCARLLALVVVHILPTKTIPTGSNANYAYTRAHMYWLGVISTHDPHVVHATLRKAGQNVCDAPSMMARGVVGGGDPSRERIDILPMASLEDCKLVCIGDLTSARLDLIRFLSQWHEWRSGSRPGVVLQEPSGNSSSRQERSIRVETSSVDNNNIVTVEDKQENKEERSEAESCNTQVHQEDVECISDDLPHSSSRSEIECCSSPPLPSSSPPKEESVHIAIAATVQLPSNTEEKQGCLSPISTSALSPITATSSSYRAEDAHLGHLAASLLVARRPLERATDSVNFVHAVSLARQRLMILTDLMHNGVEWMQYGQIQLLQYVNHNAVSSGAHYSSALTRRTEARLEERQCAAFLVCMAACLTERRIRAWYMDGETLLGECLYRTLCNNSDARQCAYEQVPELNNTNAHNTPDAYRMDTQTRWTQTARQRVQTAVGVIQGALMLDADSGMLSDRSPSIPEELEDALCDLKGTLLSFHQQYCASVQGEGGGDPQKDIE